MFDFKVLELVLDSSLISWTQWLLFRHEAEVLTGTNGDDVALDACVGQVMRLEGDATLFAIELGNDFASAKLYIEVGSLLVEDAAIKSWFHFSVPNCL